MVRAEAEKECPECRGTGQINAENCHGCQGSGKIIVHSHEHSHSGTVHDHPHPHTAPHHPNDEIDHSGHHEEK